MKVLIDSHMIGSKEGGNERYVKNLFEALVRLKNDRIYQYLPSIKESNLYRLLIGIPSKVRNERFDIVHSTYSAPIIKNAQFVVTLHDVSFKRFPQHFNLREQLMFNYLVAHSLHRADAVIVPSEFTKNESLYFFPWLKNKLHVIHYAPDDIFHEIEHLKAKEYIKAKYKIKNNFLLCFNSKYPRKNTQTIIDAFNEVKDKYKNLDLVIVGGMNNLNPRTLNSRIHTLSYVAEIDLNYFYNACEIFIYYSIYEGFGLPILEAIQCGCSIILSDTEVHKEITVNKLLYGNKESVKELAELIASLLDKSTLKQQLVGKINRLKNMYSWEKTAKSTLQVYESILN